MGIFDRLFGKKNNNSNPAKPPQAEGYTNIGQNVFPLVRPKSHRELVEAENRNRPIVTKALFEDMVISFQIETKQGWLPLDTQTMEQAKLPLDEIMACAMRNLMGRTQSSPQVKSLDFSSKAPGAKPFYQISFSENLDSSMLFNSGLFEHIAKQIGATALAMAVPTKKTVYVSDMKVMESFRTMTAISSILYDEAKAEKDECSPNTYILKAGKWVTFKDTEKQFNELMS